MKPQVRGCKPLNLMLLAAWVALAGMFVPPAQAGSVDLITREYEDGEVDLSVKVAGGSVDIERVFRDNRWEFDGIDERVNLSRYRAGESGSVLERNRVEFRRVAGSAEIYETQLGNTGHALLLLEKAVKLHANCRALAAQDPDFAPLKNDPLFLGLLDGSIG